MLYPYGYRNSKATLDELRARYAPKMHPEYARRLFAMIEAANGLVGIGGGWRSSATQAANYERDPKTFAPPGFSFHESQTYASGIVGYAAVDTVGVDGRHRDAWQWIAENAHRFGLVEFSAVNREPWHVQVSDVPKSVREWKASGSPDPGRFPLPTDEFVPVVDVSKWQGEIDFAKLRSTGVLGVIARAGNGKEEGPDPRFAEYVTGAHSAGLTVGAYYWLRPFAGDPEGQAQSFAAEVEAADPSGDVVRFLMLDVEWNDIELGPEPTAAFIRLFLAALRSATGKPIIGYSGASYWNANVGDDALAAELDWIVPTYSRKGEAPPSDPGSWYSWITQSRKRPVAPRGAGAWQGWQISSELVGADFGVSSSRLDANLVRLRAWQDWTGTRPAPPIPEPDPPAPDPEPEPDPTEEVTVNVSLRKLSKKTSGVVQDVKRLQGLLNAQSDAGLEVDGRFGPKTEAKVRDWQIFFGLEVDGIVGPQTWTTLLEVGK